MALQVELMLASIEAKPEKQFVVFIQMQIKFS